MDDLGLNYWATRFLFQRSLGLIYLIAFAVVVNQFPGLCGSKGLLPAASFLKRVNFWDAPSIFWLNFSDAFLLILSWTGLVLSVLALTGISDSHGIYLSVTVWFLLWLIYLSFVNIGQTFYSFGWEILLLEAGFLTIFLGSSDTKPPILVVWLLSWLLFRLMFGAGLIKIRGDECWRDLTCMLYHYETQPMPNPLSWFFHHLPVSIHKGAVLFNHLVELVVPFFYFFPKPWSWVAGGLTIIFQALLIVSGNFSWLNYITIFLAIPCFDDSFFVAFLPLNVPAPLQDHILHRAAVIVLTLFVIFRSIQPLQNLLSPSQIMNTSFDPFHFVNTYGAFGSITRIRREIVIEGTSDTVISENTHWQAYEFKGKPGDPKKIPPFVAPYHLRLDWLMWFAAFRPYAGDYWFLQLMQKLLSGEKEVERLLAKNPFRHKPPEHVRANLYEYHYTTRAELLRTGAWWKRELIGTYCPALGRHRRRKDA